MHICVANILLPAVEKQCIASRNFSQNGGSSDMEQVWYAFPMQEIGNEIKIDRNRKY